jgi:enoyl-CoA hydratase/carnithine racemase
MAMYLCLTGEMIDAAEALRVGLVQRVVPFDELQAEAGRIAGLIASKAPLAVAAAKRAVAAAGSLSLDDGLALEALLFGRAVMTDDFREGSSAFLEKRKPDFRGR